MVKNTNEMEQEISKADNIYDMIDANRQSFRTEELSEYIGKLLEEKGLKPAESVRNSCLERCYGHQIISGKRIPSRDKLIALSFGMKLSLDETNDLLKISCNRTLYARDKRDAVIIFALINNMDIIKTNELLFEKGLEIIS